MPETDHVDSMTSIFDVLALENSRRGWIWMNSGQGVTWQSTITNESQTGAADPPCFTLVLQEPCHTAMELGRSEPELFSGTGWIKDF